MLNFGLLGNAKPNPELAKKSEVALQIGDVDWYKSVEIWVVNPRLEVLCLQQSLVAERYPGKWRSYLAAQLRPGQTYLERALETVVKDLGVVFSPQDLYPLTTRIEGSPERFTQIFVLSWTGASDGFMLNPLVLQQIKWYTLLHLSEAVKHGLIVNPIDPSVLKFLNNPTFTRASARVAAHAI